MTFMLVYGFLEIAKPVMGVSQISMCAPFSSTASQFFGNFEITFAVIYGFFEMS